MHKHIMLTLIFTKIPIDCYQVHNQNHLTKQYLLGECLLYLDLYYIVFWQVFGMIVLYSESELKSSCSQVCLFWEGTVWISIWLTVMAGAELKFPGALCKGACKSAFMCQW